MCQRSVPLPAARADRDTVRPIKANQDALRRQIGKKAKKICPTIKRRKSLATKLILAATPALVISPYASQLWIDLDLYSGHINATSETTAASVCTRRWSTRFTTEVACPASAWHRDPKATSVCTSPPTQVVHTPVAFGYRCNDEARYEPSTAVSHFSRVCLPANTQFSGLVALANFSMAQRSKSN